MDFPDRPPARENRWTSLWVVAFLSLLLQLFLCQFFSFGEAVPVSLDINPSNLWKLAYHYPPTGSFQVLNWLGLAYLPQPLNPFSLAAAWLSPWWFFTTYTPLMSTLALLSMAAFLREWDLSRQAALFGAVVYAWQGDILSFVYPGHYAYIATWPFFALGAWGALRSQRTGHWSYALISGSCCGLMVGLEPDRGGIASLLIGALYLAAFVPHADLPLSSSGHLLALRNLLLCIAVAGLVALAPLLALFKSNIVGVKLAGTADREETYKFVTQFSIGPAETLTYLVPGFFGWHSNHPDGPYWGWVGEWPDWPKTNPHQGLRNLDLAIMTTGTVASLLAIIGALTLFPGDCLGKSGMTYRQRFHGRVLLAMAVVGVILAWGWHTEIYRCLFMLPLMDKWRNPLKWLEWTNFALVVLSAIGTQHVILSLKSDGSDTSIIRSRLGWFSLGALILLILGLAATFPLAVILASVLQAEAYAPITIANIMSTMHTSMFWACLLTAFLCLILRALWQPERLRQWAPGVNPWLHHIWQQMLQPHHLSLTLALALSLLSIVQLTWVASHFLQSIPLQFLTESNPLLEELRSESKAVRASVAADDGVLNSLLQNQFSAMKISCLDVSAASRIPNDINAFFKTLQKDQARLWFLTGVKNVVVPQQMIAQMRNDAGVSANIAHADGYTLDQTGSPNLPSHALVVMKDYLEKATLVPHAEFFTSDDEMLERLKDADWNPREIVLLNPGHKLPQLPQPTSVSATDHVELKTYTPTEIEIDVQSIHGGYVLINDQFDPDWEVRLNGQPAELLRANYIMRAIEVPPGKSSLSLHYVAKYQIAGKPFAAESISNFSDATMLGAWLIAGIALWRWPVRTSR